MTLQDKTAKWIVMNPDECPLRPGLTSPDMSQRTHGTYGGYAAHNRDRTPICDPCHDAMRAYHMANRTALTENNRRYRESHRLVLAAKQRAYREANYAPRERPRFQMAGRMKCLRCGNPVANHSLRGCQP